MEKHFDELARLYPSYVHGPRRPHHSRAVRRGPRPRRSSRSCAARVAKLEAVEKDLRQSVEEGLRCAALADDAQREAASAWLIAHAK